ncbi:MAG TPA: hypothetical protein PKD51_14265 [Saprospiraceae bacterium]|nr:hypothetical protein [Saprospiraceae bacterium]
MEAKMFSKFMLIFLLLTTACLHAQYSHNNPTPKNAFTRFLIPERVDTTCITFGQKLTCINITDDLVTWEIKEKVSGNVISSGNGATLHDYIFAMAGSYEVSLDHHLFYDPNSCNHGSLPDLIEVIVSPVTAKYKFETITFSSQIQDNIATDGIQVTLDLEVALQDMSSYNFIIPPVMTNGTDTHIVATPLQEQVSLVNGINTLNFVLNGLVTRPSYIVFDFVDPNGKIQDYIYSLINN